MKVVAKEDYTSDIDEYLGGMKILTKDRIYDSKYGGSSLYLVQADDGNLRYLAKFRFITLEESRTLKLYKLGL